MAKEDCRQGGCALGIANLLSLKMPAAPITPVFHRCQRCAEQSDTKLFYPTSESRILITNGKNYHVKAKEVFECCTDLKIKMNGRVGMSKNGYQVMR